jgi:hypothetical protein
MSNRGGPISILLFADSILGIQPYDWQCQILINYEARKANRGRMRKLHREDIHSLPDRSSLDFVQLLTRPPDVSQCNQRSG